MTKGEGKERLKNRVIAFVVKNRVFFILAVICVALTIIQPIFFRPRNMMNIFRQVSASAVLGVGFSFLLGSGNIDLSVGTQIGMIGVIVAKMSKVSGMPFTVVVLAGLLVGTLCGVINALFINRFRLPPFIVTLATMSMFKGICYIMSNTTPVSGIAPSLVVLGQGFFLGIPIIIWIMAVVTVLMYLIINKTIFGRHAIAMGGNLEAASFSGVNTNLMRIGVFVVMGLCSAIAALMMTGRAASAQPMAGQGMEMDAIAAAVIGGTPMSGGDAKIFGTLMGCVIVGVINNGLNLLNVDSNFQQVVKGLMILVAVILDAQSSVYFANRKVE